MADKPATYPKRPQHFAHKFCRVLTKAAAALEIGADACWLLTLIAHQEDVKRYSGAVNYWNAQLMGIAGLNSVDRLIRVRDRAVAAGWLHYEAGGRSKPGLYWVTIPKQHQGIKDSPCDESIEPDHSRFDSRDDSQNTTQNATANAVNPRVETRSIRESSNPNPSPSPETSSDDDVGASDFQRIWSETFGVKPCHTMNGARRAALKARLRERWWRENWRAALAKVPECPFLIGNGRNGWVADVDWFLKPKSAAAILEGKYDDGRSGKNRGDAGLRHESDVEDEGFLVAGDA